MKRQLLLPATIAAGLHAVLLLGFKSSSHHSATAQPSKPTEVFSYHVPELEPPEKPEVFDLDDDSKPPPPEKPAPQQRERYEIEPSGSDRQKLVVPPVFTGSMDGNTTVIPARWGDGNGADPREVIFNPDALDRPPTVLFRESPRVGNDLIDSTSAVTVTFVVGKDGRVVDARIVDSNSSNRHLDDECLRAVRRWRFEPGTRYAVPVAFRVQQAFLFNPTN